MNPDELSTQLAAMHTEAFGWALHCCHGDAGLAEEVLQNAYVKCLQGRLHHDGAGSVKAWWLEVIRWTAREEWRRLRRSEGRLMAWLRSWLGDAEEPADAHSHPARQTELDDDAARLRGLLARLPARQAEVLHLVFLRAPDHRGGGGGDERGRRFRAAALRAGQAPAARMA